MRALASRYLAFVSHAFDRQAGRFRNTMSYARRWLEPGGSEDSHGRALWALGTVVGRSTDPGRRGLSARLFHAALRPPRADQPPGLGLRPAGHRQYLRGAEATASSKRRGEPRGQLVERYHHSRAEAWPWFSRLTTPTPGAQARAGVGGANGRRRAAGIAEKSLQWLVNEQPPPTAPSRRWAPTASCRNAAGNLRPAVVEACGGPACLTRTAHREAGGGARALPSTGPGRTRRNADLRARTGGCRDGFSERERGRGAACSPRSPSRAADARRPAGAGRNQSRARPRARRAAAVLGGRLP